jgi:hypothetical protein
MAKTRGGVSGSHCGSGLGGSRRSGSVGGSRGGGEAQAQQKTRRSGPRMLWTEDVMAQAVIAVQTKTMSLRMAKQSFKV